MVKVIRSPGKYVQGANVLEKAGSYLNIIGKKILVLSTPSVFDKAKSTLAASLKEAGVSSHVVKFNRECSKNEINRLGKILKKEQCDAVVGMGGGKAMDTAKAVAFYNNVPSAIIPTIASSDAPCSALSVIYTDDGVFEEYLLLPQNPQLILVDTQIIANAPARLLMAGIGDALATFFEARATSRANKSAMAGGIPTVSAMAIAETCYNTLLDQGLKAKFAAEQHLVTDAVEQIVEANTYLSGVGFESGGLAAAHAVHNGLTAIEETHAMYHGEKVTFGVLAQLVLENAPLEEIDTVCEFCVDLGLPITLTELHITTDIEKKVKIVAERACAEGETIHNMPFPVTPDMAYAAILTANKIGHSYLAD